MFRIEREFNIELDRNEIMQILIDGNTTEPPKGAWTDIQVRDFVKWVRSNVERQNPLYDEDVFDGVKQQIVECLMVDGSEVTPDEWMVRDLGAE